MNDILKKSSNADKNFVIPKSIFKGTQDDIMCFKFLEQAFYYSCNHLFKRVFY